MSSRKFEKVSIKFGLLKIFEAASKSGQRPCTIVQGHWQNFIKNGKVPFLLHFLIHIHVLMLCRKFELVLTKFGFFMNF